MSNDASHLVIALFLLGIIILGFVANWLKLACDEPRYYFILGGVVFGYFIGRLTKTCKVPKNTKKQ